MELNSEWDLQMSLCITYATFALNEASSPSLKFYNPIFNTLVVIACHKSLDSNLKRSTCVGYLHQHEIKELNILHHFYNVMTAKDSSDHLTLELR